MTPPAPTNQHASTNQQAPTNQHAPAKAPSPAHPHATKTLAQATAWKRTYRRFVIAYDVATVLICVAAGHFLRFGINGTDLSFPGGSISYAAISVLLAGAWIALLATSGAWRIEVLGSGTDEYRRIMRATFFLFGLVAAGAYLSKTELARGYVLLTLPLGLAALWLTRLVWNAWRVHQYRSGRLRNRVLIVGSPGAAVALAHDLDRNPTSGYQVVGLAIPEGASIYDVSPELPLIRGFTDLPAAAARLGAESIAVTKSEDFDATAVRMLAWQLERSTIDLVLAPRTVDVSAPKFASEPVPGLSLVKVSKPRFSGPRYVVKYVFDFVFAAFALVVASPVMLAAAIAIKLDDHGPVFFRQERVGKDGKLFRIWKFRSMTVPDKPRKTLLTDGSTPTLYAKIQNEAEITKVGAFLRKSSIDELPQFFNVLGGRMSIVGPRPLVPWEAQQLDGFVSRRTRVKPGITGLWQVSGRSSLTGEAAARLDLTYVDHWTLLGDVGLILRTIHSVALQSDAS